MTRQWYDNVDKAFNKVCPVKKIKIRDEQTGGTRIVKLLSTSTDPSTKGHTVEVAPLQLI
jgi:hypothetical protein